MKITTGNKLFWFWVGLFLLAFIFGYLTRDKSLGAIVVPPAKALAMPKILPSLVTGKASYYDYILKSGWSSKGHRICAVRDWPRYSILEVTNLANGQKVRCKVTDHGPEKAKHPDRIVDLSSTAFSDIADKKLGIINVNIEQIQ